MDCFHEFGMVCMIVVTLYNLKDNCMLSVYNLLWCVNEISKILAIEQIGSSSIL